MEPLLDLVRTAPGAAVTSVFVLLACPTARAQATLYTFYGDSVFDKFGVSVAFSVIRNP